MGKIPFCALALTIYVGLTVLAVGTKGAQTNESSNATVDRDGSFRDGLYVGRFSAERGLPMLPPVGRWSTQRDREAFLAGYNQGYGAVIEARSQVAIPRLINKSPK